MRSRLLERVERTRARDLWESASALLQLRALKALARLIAVCIPIALAVLATPVHALSEPDSAATAPAGTAAQRADERSAQPAKAAPVPDAPTQFYSRSASKQWVDRLTKARRRVLGARHALDAANTAYARALYEEMPEGAALQAIAEHRGAAKAELASALDAVPDLVEAARRDGVSPEILKIYEESIPD